MRYRSMARQAGFTLIEIAIVLVIIGILIVGVLQGTEMIENSKTKSILQDMRGIAAAYNSYYDRYRALPGDETAATMTARGWLGAAGGAGTGVITITPATAFTTGAPQGPGFWRALTASGFVSGNPAAGYLAALPTHRGEGRIAVVTGPVYGLAGTFVCASGLSTKQVAALDTLVDGPPPANQIGNDIGNFRADTGAANPLPPTAAPATATPYNIVNVTTPWTGCMRISG